MKFLTKFAVILLLCGFAGSAHAYRINVLDPTVYEILPGSLTTGVNISFEACATAQLHVSPGTSTAGYGCYSAFNETGSDITTLELVFSKTGAFASGFSCSQDSIGGLSFANETCSEGAGQIALFFSGGDGIPQSGPANNYAYFTIFVSDLPPGTDLSTLPQATVTSPNAFIVPLGAESPVPEPSSIALLSTGLASVGAATWRKRRWFAGRNT